MFPGTPLRSRLFLSISAVLVATACGNASYGTAGNNPPPPTVADIKIVSGAQTKANHAFNPNPYTVALNGAGSVTVKWGNDDSFTHTVTEDGANPSFNSNNLTPGSVFSFQFTAAGTYNYHCSIHHTMVGQVVVTP